MFYARSYCMRFDHIVALNCRSRRTSFGGSMATSDLTVVKSRLTDNHSKTKLRLVLCFEHVFEVRGEV